MKLAGCAIALCAFALATGCASEPVGHPASGPGRTAPEVALAEHVCMGQLKDYLTTLPATRLDTFFRAALNGLLRCQANSGLAHVPTTDITTWLAHASGKPAAVKIPVPPRQLGLLPRDDGQRLAYQRACSGYLRNYLPASIARAGDEPDVAAAFVFNALEECDSTAGFATIAPNELAKIMQAKRLL